MGPLVDGILGLLIWMRRLAVLVILGFAFITIWLALRRSGRKGLDLALFLFGAALASFTAAVVAPRPPMSEALAIGLALLAAVLLVASVGALIWYGLRRRRVPPIMKHTHPPWENGGW